MIMEYWYLAFNPRSQDPTNAFSEQILGYVH